MHPNMMHNCIRGITENLNRISDQITQLQKRKDPHDHLDGLKFALHIINEKEQYFKLLGINYSEQDRNPFHELRNEIRMLLGLPLIAR